MFNHAVYAMRQDDANRRDARFVELDANGNATNTYPNGEAFSLDVINAAREIAKENAYRETMAFLDSIFGSENDTQTVKRFDLAKSKIKDRAHAEELQAKLIDAALNGSNAAIIAYASVSLFLNPYAPVDFGWYVNGSDELANPVTAEDGYLVWTAPAGQPVGATVSVSLPTADTAADYEGFAVTYRVATPTIPTMAPTTPPTPLFVTLVDGLGRVLTQTATGWQAESKSAPGTFHTTTHNGESCDCEGHKFHGHCWHAKAVMVNQAQEQPKTDLPRTLSHNGIFTANFGDHHRTFKIKAQKENASFMPGRRVVYLLTGSNPDDYADWTSFGVFRDDGTISLWKSKRESKWEAHATLLANPASQPDVEWNSDESCIFCNRTLTTPTSSRLGYGPTCAKKQNLPYA